MLRIAGEGYIIVGSKARDVIWKQLMEKWDRIVLEVRRGSVEQAMELYLGLFEWVDGLGRRVPKYHGVADIVLPPRDLKADELQSLLESTSGEGDSIRSR